MHFFKYASQHSPTYLLYLLKANNPFPILLMFSSRVLPVREPVNRARIQNLVELAEFETFLERMSLTV